MKIFLDTANIDQIKKAVDYGFLDGVTTNPTLASKEGVPYEKNVKEICAIVDGPVSAECVREDYNGLIEEALTIAKWAKNVVIKVPMTWDGLKATKTLSEKGIKVNMTLCFSPTQALLSAKAGATFISPFIGRIDDMGENGVELIKNIVTIFKNYGYKTEVLAASIRHIGHVIEVAKAGADVATMPYAIYEKMARHILTDKGLQIFKDDYNKIPRQ